MSQPTGAVCSNCGWTGGPEHLAGRCPQCDGFLERVDAPRASGE